MMMTHVSSLSSFNCNSHEIKNKCVWYSDKCVVRRNSFYYVFLGDKKYLCRLE